MRPSVGNPESPLAASSRRRLQTTTTPTHTAPISPPCVASPAHRPPIARRISLRHESGPVPPALLRPPPPAKRPRVIARVSHRPSLRCCGPAPPRPVPDSAGGADAYAHTCVGRRGCRYFTLHAGRASAGLGDARTRGEADSLGNPGLARPSRPSLPSCPSLYSMYANARAIYCTYLRRHPACVRACIITEERSRPSVGSSETAERRKHSSLSLSLITHYSAPRSSPKPPTRFRAPSLISRPSIALPAGGRGGLREAGLVDVIWTYLTR